MKGLPDAKIKSVLNSGEVIVWSARPSPLAHVLEFLHLTMFVFILFVMLFAMLTAPFVFYFFFILILSLAYSDYSKAKKIAYVITNQRAFIVNLRKCKVISNYYPEGMLKIKVHRTYCSRGNVLFSVGCEGEDIGFIGIEEMSIVADHLATLKGING